MKHNRPILPDSTASSSWQ